MEIFFGFHWNECIHAPSTSLFSPFDIMLKWVSTQNPFLLLKALFLFLFRYWLSHSVELVISLHFMKVETECSGGKVSLIYSETTVLNSTTNRQHSTRKARGKASHPFYLPHPLLEIHYLINCLLPTWKGTTILLSTFLKEYWKSIDDFSFNSSRLGTGPHGILPTRKARDTKILLISHIWRRSHSKPYRTSNGCTKFESRTRILKWMRS